METYTLTYKTGSQWELLCDSGNSTWGSLTTRRGGEGGGGREAQEEEDVCIPKADPC